MALILVVCLATPAWAADETQQPDTKPANSTQIEQIEQILQGKSNRKGQPQSPQRTQPQTRQKTRQPRIKKFIPSEQIKADTIISLPSNI